MTDFENLVANMRKAQKEYFRYRTPAALNESKRLEREVDRALEKIHEQDIHAPEQTPDLFQKAGWLPND